MIEPGDTFVNDFGTELVIRCRLPVMWGNPILGETFEANEPDVYLGFRRWLVTADGLKQAGYVKVLVSA